MKEKRSTRYEREQEPMKMLRRHMAKLKLVGAPSAFKLLSLIFAACKRPVSGNLEPGHGTWDLTYSVAAHAFPRQSPNTYSMFAQ